MKIKYFISIFGILVLSSLFFSSTVVVENKEVEESTTLNNSASTTIVINEFCTSPDWIELRNYGDSDIVMTGWKLGVYTDDGLDGTYNFTAGWIFKANSIVVLYESGNPADDNSTHLYSDFNFMFTNDRELMINLTNSVGTNIDWVQTNGTTLALSGGATWTNNSLFCNVTYGHRIQDLDTDSSSDWTNSTVGTPHSPNPFQSAAGPIVINEFWTGGPDWIELRNCGPNMDMTNWTIDVFSDGGYDGQYQFNDSWTFYNNSFIIIKEESGKDNKTHLHSRFNFGWTDDDQVSINLTDANGNNVDWVESDDNTVSRPSDATWIKDKIFKHIEFGYRNKNPDCDKASDWSNSSTGTPGALNPGQSDGSCVCDTDDGDDDDDDDDDDNDDDAPPAIPGYSVFLVLMVVAVSLIIVTKKKSK